MGKQVSQICLKHTVMMKYSILEQQTLSLGTLQHHWHSIPVPLMMPNNPNRTLLLDPHAHLPVISSRIEEISNPKNISTQYKKEERASALANTTKFGTRESFTKI